MRARVLTPFLVALALTACGSEKSSQPAPAQTPMPTPPSPAPDPAQPVPPMPTPPTPAADAPATDLARMSNRFALDLWAKTPPGNLAISPSSIATALTIAWGGAKGTTKEQMTKLLHLEGTPEAILSRWGNLSKSLAAPKAGMTLEIANRLYGEKTYPFDTIYFTIARKAFDVWIEPVDFVGDAEGVRQKINTWVAEQTEQKIKDLLPPRTVDASTALVIVNAIYFLADWATPFAPSATRPEDFFVGGKTAAKVPMMHRTGEYKLAHKDGAALLELPYTNNVAAMYVLLPDARDGLPAIEAKLADTMKALQPALAEQQVAVALPRFKLEASAPMSLRKPLEALGMTDAFDPAKADFTDIAKPKNERDKIAISEVLHKAFVKVDEKGTEAAAATAVVMPRGGRPPSPTQFVADHPFLFFIADRATGMILFIGRVVEPKE